MNIQKLIDYENPRGGLLIKMPDEEIEGLPKEVLSQLADAAFAGYYIKLKELRLQFGLSIEGLPPR